jgi:predicted SprT family Zn-dependent metalloprotease
MSVNPDSVTPMNLIDANTAAHQLVSHHLAGQGWRIGWNTNKSRMGVCKYATKTLEFSSILMKEVSNEEAINTILHEIAHALMGPGHDHSAAWAAQHRAIGGNGKRCWNNPELIAKVAKWVMTCQNCGTKAYRNRLAKGYIYHPSCGRVKGQMTIQAQR